MPEITCILVSHNKPKFVLEAINSVLYQSFQDWQCILIDSGELFNSGFFKIDDPRFEVMFSGETEYLRRTKAMAPWCFNECFRRKLVKGNLVVYLCDDDIWYDNAFQTFINVYKNAMYASQDLANIDKLDNAFIYGERRALTVRGKFAKGESLDCKVDYLQFCHKREMFKEWPEDKKTETHADGLFMERIGEITPVYPIDIKIGQNRRTPLSTYGPSNG